jgi:class 3 adenylate cyclase/predicted ATPase
VDVAAWLRGVGLPQYERAFEDNAIDGEVLPQLTDELLKELGVPLGHRLKLLKAIAALENESSALAVAAAGERRQVTVMFVDLVGFTELSAGLDAEEVHDVLGRFFEIADRIVTDHGGTVDKHIGDCVMALFGAPVAHSDDPERSMRAALAIQAALPAVGAELRRDIAVHIGIASGEVVAAGTGSAAHREYTVTGESVNLAARLVDQATSGEVLVSEAIHKAVGERFGMSVAGEVSLQGFARPVRIWRVSGEIVATPASRGRPFVGRKAELGQLHALLEMCRDQARGHLVHVRGEAGIGKTRLVEELLQQAAAKGVSAHKALVLDFGAGKGQDAIRALIASLLGLDITADDAARRAAAARTITDGYLDGAQLIYLNDLLDLSQPPELRAIYDAMDNAARLEGKRRTACDLIDRLSRREPRLLVVEDMHWADPITLGYLARLASAVADCAVLLVLTSRVEGDPLDPAWRTSAGDVAMTTIDLTPLRREEAFSLAAAVVDASTRFAQTCIERAGGNPLFLEQLLRTAEDATDNAVPGSIQSVVLARMDMLQPRDRMALQAASVLGQRFELSELRAVLGDAAYVCDELIQRFLIRPEGAGFLFVHALIRDGAYASLLQPRRRELHRRAAAWFAGRDTALQAEHLDYAGDPAAPAGYLAAAREQARAYRYQRARRLVERGLALATTRADRFALASFNGEILRELGATSQSLAAYEQALAAAESSSDACRARIGLAGCMRMLDRYDDAFRLLNEAEEGADGLDLELARLHHLQGNLCFPLGQIDRCRAEHDLALEHARRAGSVELEARALGGLGDADYMCGRMRTAADRFSACVELARREGLGRIEVANLPMVGHCLMYVCEFERAIEVAHQALDLASRVGHLRAEIIVHNLLADIGQARNEPDLYEVAASRIQELAQKIGSKRFEAHALQHQAAALRLRGRLDAAEALLEESISMARESGLQFLGPWMLAQLAATTRDSFRRAQALAEVQALLAQGSVGHNYLWAYRYALEAALEAGGLDEVERYAQALEDYTSAEPLRWADLWVHWGRALAGHARDPTAPQTRTQLLRVRDEAVALGMASALPLLDRALLAAGPPEPEALH